MVKSLLSGKEIDGLGFPLLRVTDQSDTPISPEEPDHFLYASKGSIGYIEWEHETLVEIGRFNVVFADITGGEAIGLNLRETLDGMAKTEEMTVLFDDEGAEFSEAVLKVCGEEVFGRNLLLLDRIEILPAYRGYGLANLVTKALIRRFGKGAGMAVIKPFPLQFEMDLPGEASEWKEWRQRMGYSEMKGSQASATKSLKAFYKRLGFNAVPKTGLMVMPNGLEF
jgi:GNAT superfamily N-acetyltransferase